MNFKKIEGYPYVIHPCGTILRIWKDHTREVKPYKQKTGYMGVGLRNKSKQKKFFVHRLLALQFIENDDPDNNIHIDHINDIRDDNRLENLEWVSQAENNRRREYVKNPSIITKGGIYKVKYGWIWYYYMSGKVKSNYLKSKTDLEKFRKDKLAEYNIHVDV